MEAAGDLESLIDSQSSAASRRTTAGVLLTILSGLAFGTLALFAHRAYDAGIGQATLLFLRFGIASLLLGSVAIYGRRAMPRGKDLALLIVMGGLYVGQSYCYFAALKHAPASLVSLMLYLYPGIVTVASVALLGERLNLPKSIALAMAVGGSILTVGPISSASPAGIWFGVGTALFYAAYILVGAKALKAVDATAASLVVVATAAVFYAALVLAQGAEFPTVPSGWAWPILLAVFSTVIAITAFLAGLERIGPVNASTLSAIEPVATATVAVLFLGDRLQPLQICGGVLILAAVIILARKATAPQ